jgi:hypothetical protein
MQYKDGAMKLSEKKLLKQIIKESILLKIIGAVNEGHISNMARGIKGLFSKSEDVPKDANQVQDISKIPETKTLGLLIGNEIKAQNDEAERTGSVYRWMGFSDENIEKFSKIFKNLLPQHMKLVLDFYKSSKEPAYDSMIEKFQEIYEIRSASKGRY